MLKFDSYDIMFQEVPNETSLVFFITNCPYKCKGCHSQHLWEDIGDSMWTNFSLLLKRYKDFITCVCFMGGDQELDELSVYLKEVKDSGLKTCLYTGSNTFSKDHEESLKNIDFLKEGEYIRELGGLENSTTNQKFYEIIDGKIVKELFFYDNKEEKNEYH